MCPVERVRQLPWAQRAAPPQGTAHLLRHQLSAWLPGQPLSLPPPLPASSPPYSPLPSHFLPQACCCPETPPRAPLGPSPGTHTPGNTGDPPEGLRARQSDVNPKGGELTQGWLRCLAPVFEGSRVGDDDPTALPPSEVAGTSPFLGALVESLLLGGVGAFSELNRLRKST